MIRDKCSLDGREFETVRSALERLAAEEITLEEAFALQEPLLAKLKTAFSVTESGYYTIRIQPSGGNRFGGRALIFSLRVDGNPPSQGFKWLQWQFL